MTLSFSMAALLISFYALYKNHLERVKILILTSDKVGLVVQNGTENIPKFNILCNLANQSAKLGTVHRLESNVRVPTGQELTFVWKLFYEYLPGGEVMTKTIDTHPIAIQPKDKNLVGIQFEGPVFNEKFYWAEGRYEIEIVGWINRRHRGERRNARSCFHININSNECASLRYYTDAGKADSAIAKDPHNAVLVPIDIEEWSLSQRNG